MFFGKKNGLFDLEEKRDELMKAMGQIVVPEFGQNLEELGWIKDLAVIDNKLTIDVVLPTFGLRSEEATMGAMKKAAVDVVGDAIEIRLNAFADVAPVTGQSLFQEGISDVRNIILVASGKGGVGKSTVASNLAAALARLGCRTGLVDADVYGPSVPIMFGVEQNVQIEGVQFEGHEQPFMIPVEKHGVKLMSIGFLVDTDQAMVWRGPMIAQASMQMFYNVAWGDIDYLIVDMPPGTGDIQLTIAQRLMAAGSVVVSTPQNVALADVVRAKSMFDRVNVPQLGLVENMSYFICDGCDKRHEIFTHGGAKKSAEALNIPFLGEIPLEGNLMRSSDDGKPEVIREPGSASSRAFIELAHEISTRLAQISLDGSVADSSGPTIQISGKPKGRRGGLPVLS